jgi:uncharacterized membrane protein YjjP (DUF1212 family)
MSVPAADVRSAFVLEVGKAMQTLGVPAHRFEEALEEMCTSLGIEGDFFALPTAFIANLQEQDRHRTHVVRQGAGNPDLSKLDELKFLTDSVRRGHLTPEGGLYRLRSLMARPSLHALQVVVPCFGLVSCAAAGVLGGGWHEMLVAIPLGLLVGLLSVGSETRPTLARVLPALAATLVALAGALTAPYASVKLVVLAGLIILFPGLKLLISLNELATGNLVAGAARLADVGITLVQLAFGAALGQQLGITALKLLPLHRSLHVVHPLPEALQYLPVAGLAAGLLVLFQARWRDYPWILGGCLLAMAGTRLGAHWLGASFGAAMGAFAITLGSNLLSRVTHRTPSLTLLPGLLVLVPGSLGFRGLASIFQNQVVSGLDTAFQMLFLAVALLFGLLLAHLAGPERPPI